MRLVFSVIGLLIGAACTIDALAVWAVPGPNSSFTFRVVWTVASVSVLLASGWAYWLENRSDA